MLRENSVLVLNAGWQPISTKNASDAICDLCSGSVRGLDISYNKDPFGKLMIDSPLISVINSWEDWVKLLVHEYHSFVRSQHLSIRMPTVVIAHRYNKIPIKTLRPTKDAIRNRDNFICQYSGRRIPKSKGDIDHIIPISRGGKNSWSNMVWCCRDINRMKSDKTPEEVGLKLIKRPLEIKPLPASAFIREIKSQDWDIFLNK